ncbi:hypothetical protein JCM10207_008579 [Rhodosporidiobolus poonsookiae]
MASPASPGPVVQALLFPLHLSTLVVLHAAFASCRFARLVAHLWPTLRLPRPALAPTPAGDVAAQRWRKLPRHLAVRFAPGGRGGWGMLFRRRSDEEELDERVKQLRLLITWCTQLGIDTLSVYDETGLLTHHARHIAAQLGLEVVQLDGKAEGEMEGLVTLRRREERGKGAQGTMQSCTERKETAVDDAESAGSSATLVDSPPSPSLSLTASSAPGVTLNLLSRAAGRPQLARVAQALAVGRMALKPETELTGEAVAEVIDALPLGEPDLLFVLGGPYLRLQGFPPWQLKLSEMYHHSSPSWLPPPPLTYDIFRRALDLFGRAEMRLGR